MLELTFGHDVELFLTKNSEIIPSCGKIGGDKHNPMPISASLSVLEDNVTIELNGPPSFTISDFGRLCSRQEQELSGYLSSKGYGFNRGTWKKFSPSSLNNPKALMIGCEPDYDAFQKMGVQRPIFDIQEFGTKRFAGGHIHIGFPPKYSFKVPPFVHVRFYAIVGALYALARGQKEYERRKYYGLPGLFRLKNYGDDRSGIEYRSLGNWWFPSGYAIVENMAKVSSFLEENPALVKEYHSSIPWSDVSQAVLSDDPARAADMYDYIAGIAPELLL